VHGLYVRLERFAARCTTRLIAVSAATRDKGLALKIGRPEQYAVIVPGSDLEAFAPADAETRRRVRRAFGLPETAPLVGMVACFKPQKAPVDFVRAAGLVAQRKPEARFLLVGDGELKPAVAAEIRRQGLEEKLILTGWRQDVDFIMRGLDLFALSSRWEGLPCVLAQAMACGVPVVATDVDGSREAVTHGQTGLLVRPGDPQALGEALAGLLTDDSQRQAMARAGLAAASRFGLAPMLRDIDRLYTSLLAAFAAKEKRP
jgi:glycosyltransferase involved in cell wall biosynthesis